MNPLHNNQLQLLQTKVTNVQTIMEENINTSLQNIDKLEDIELNSEDLMIQSGIFRNKTKELKNKLWWKNIRMKLFISCFIISILVIIIVSIVFASKNN
jgi:hypothetical protein